MNCRYILFAMAILAAVAAYGEAHVRWIETTHNFGAFSEESGPVTCEFVMVNDGPGNASIVAARATCGCTQPSYDVRALAPGDSARLSVTYDPQGRPGRFNKQVYVETSGTPQKQKLEIKGVVIGAGETVSRRYPVDLGPLKLATGGVMLGEILKGHLKTVYTEGYNQSADSMRVAVVSKPEWVEIIPTPTVAGPGEQVTLISYVNSAKCPIYGLVEDSVTICPAPGYEFTLPVTTIINEDFSALGPAGMEKAPISVLSTDLLDFGTIDAAAGPATQSLTLTNAGKNKLHVRRVYSTDPGVSVNINNDAISRGKKATITVTLDPAVQPSSLVSARVVVITDDPLQPTRTVRLAATLK